MTRARHALVAALVALAGCQSTGGARVSDLAPGERPQLDSDEAGLWLISDKMERAIRSSGRVVDEPRLKAYVDDILCQLAPEHCAGIRVQIIRTPGFNATMSPNGYMQVWTGLVLRAENEAQLAYVLGHEVGHFLKRHSLKRWRDIRSTTDAAAFFQVVTAAAGVPVVGQVGQLAALSSIYAFSRDNEREADDVGFELMARAGYDPEQAPKIWQALLAERDAEKEPERSIFFASHPSPEERVDTLRARARALAGAGGSRRSGAERHRAATASHREAWLRDELPKREFAATLVLLDRLAAAGEPAARVQYFRGEVYRLRAEEGDLALAAGALREAIDVGGAPASAHRSLGLVLWRMEDRAGARRAFERYLLESPQAEDRAMVASYIVQLGG